MKKLFTLSLIILIVFTCKEAPTDVPKIITQITGKISDKKTGIALAGVQITTLPVTSSVITGTDGSYTLSDIAPGTYKVTAQKDGYNTNSTNVTVTEGKSVSADILLETKKPELNVQPETIDFDTEQTNLTFNITNISNVGEITWTITLNQPWISVSPSSGSTSTETDIITVTVNRDNLDFGNYSALITINSDFGSKKVNVIMVKANPNAPQITVTPTKLDFGISNNSKTLFLKNTGTGTLAWTATTNESWLILSSVSGSTTSGNTSSLTVSVNKSGLTANSYTGTVLINSNGGSQVVNVAMTVQQGTLDPPTLQLIGDVTKNSISLGWTKVNDTNFDNYKLYRSIINNVDENSTLITTINDYDQNTYKDEGLNSGTVYYYKIYVYSKTGIGSGSNEVSATTSREIGSWVSTETISSLLGDINVNSMHIVSGNDIWLVGGKEIWHYNGSVWSKNFTSNESYGYYAVSFVSPNKGWAVGGSSSGFLYEYNGISWTKASDLSIDQPRDIIAFSENNIWVLGFNKIYHFKDNAWTTISLDIKSGWDLDAISENDIWALGYHGDVFHYNGLGWEFVAKDIGGVSISAISNTDVWVTSTVSGLWHYDGNKFDNSYKLENGKKYIGRFALEMISTNEGWSSLSNYTDFSYYDGNHWQYVNNPVNSNIKCIKFLTRDKGWAVTYNGTILRYVE